MMSHTVMIVDDDVDIRDTVTEALADAGYDVRAAANGKEALAALKGGEHPCLILLDLMMPEMDGEEFRAAQQNDPELATIPVVVVSAGGQAKETARRLGAADCVRKPFKMKDLFQAVQKYC